MKELQAKAKVTQTMTRDGLVVENQADGTVENVSSREAEQDYSTDAEGKAEKILERAEDIKDGHKNKKKAKKAAETAATAKSEDGLHRSAARLELTEDERADPELQPYIHKAEAKADKLDAARAALPKKRVPVKEKVYDAASGKAKSTLRFEQQDKGPPSLKPNPASRPLSEALLFAHGKIHEVEHENVGVEGGHKGEELVERQTAKAIRSGIRHHKMKPYKAVEKAERQLMSANAYKFMRRTNLKEMYIVRYADDFRIFCRTKDEAERTMKAVTQWLMERLHLEVSPTKTKIVNVKHRYSEFLGFKMKVFRRADKYVIKSHVGDKQLEHARQKLVTQAKNIIHPRKEKHERGEISLYNSIVVGLQDYYRIATCISEDCSSLGRSVMTVLTNGLKERQGSRLVRNGRKLTVFESQKYGKSKSLRYAKGTDEPVYPISYIRHSIPLSRKRAINCYTPAGRKGLHDNLKINVNLMLALMRQPIGNRSVELADNRISLFSAQYGKCAVTGMPFLTTDEIHCHHIKPKKYGGNDSYENLVLINKLIHRLVHAETVETITYYLEVCNLNKKQMEKLNALRLKAGLGEIRGTQPLKTNKVDSNRL